MRLKMLLIALLLKGVLSQKRYKSGLGKDKIESLIDSIYSFSSTYLFIDYYIYSEQVLTTPFKNA